MKQASKQNPQDEFINSLNGIYLVDAGAGTGKTFAIVNRYQKMISKGIHPREILMITFTRNAANQMKEEVISKINSDKISLTELLEAPINNFHSICLGILKNSGTNSPKYLGIDEKLTSNFSILEDFEFEKEFFRKFYNNFRKSHEEKYGRIFMSIYDKHEQVLKAIRHLCSRGIFPTDKGWFNEGEELLKGDYEQYSKLFDELNERVSHKTQNRDVQNKLYKIIKGISGNLYAEFEVDNMISDNRANPEIKKPLYVEEGRDLLLEFMRDIYHAYIVHMLKKNILNFDFVVMLCFLTLFKDEKIRNSNRFKYIMVDEFQDTDEIQFQLLLLLLKDDKGKANLAVVGDWKQGIYGFRNATIENMTEFAERISQFSEILNKGEKRILFDTNESLVKKIIFMYNYRSSQKILDLSWNTLRCPGKLGDDIDNNNLELNFPRALTAARELDDLTEICFYQSGEKAGDEAELVLQKISELVDNKKYLVREFDKEGNVIGDRRVKYSDICVLSRRKSFGLNLQRLAYEKKIPLNYDGGLELFATKQGILVLAWLKILQNEKNIEGWIPVLEKEGFTYSEMQSFVSDFKKKKTTQSTEAFADFLSMLRQRQSNIIYVVQSILKKYGFEDEFASAIIYRIGKWTDSDLISLSELIQLMDALIREKFEIELNKTSNAVLCQTIHKAKGLEYPVVIVADCNMRIFPDTKNFTNLIFFYPVSGLRLKKSYGSRNGYDYIFGNWRSDALVKMCRRSNYDEERRLLYVATTRAKQYLFLTAYKPSRFFSELAGMTNNDIKTGYSHKIKAAVDDEKSVEEKLLIPAVPAGGKKFVSVHALMNSADENDKAEFPESDTGYLPQSSDAFEYGNRIHLIAQKLAMGYESETGIEEINRLKNFINNLNAQELKTEVDFIYPKGNDVIRGTIDLLAFYDNTIEVIDYKTDKTRKGLDKYMIQIKIYMELVEKVFPRKKVKGKLFFVRLNEVVEV